MVSLFIIHSHTIVIFPTKKHVPLLSVMQCTVRCFLLQKCNVIVQPEYILTQLKRERERERYFLLCARQRSRFPRSISPLPSRLHANLTELHSLFLAGLSAHGLAIWHRGTLGPFHPPPSHQRHKSFFRY